MRLITAVLIALKDNYMMIMVMMIIIIILKNKPTARLAMRLSYIQKNNR